MRKLVSLVSLVSLGVSASACSSPAPDSTQESSEALRGRSHAAVCAAAPAGEAHCHAHVVIDASGQPSATAAPAGYGPKDLQAAYGLDPSGGSGVTVALVDAFDYPNAEADLAVYRAKFGLPPCTTANGCFSKVNQDGVRGSYPRADTGWSEEEALDIQMVSAICPNCRILLVEATSATLTNLEAAVATAARLGASAISNSYGGSEPSSAASDQGYNFPGIAVTVSTGDSGYGVEFPASSPYVTAVGGTTLTRAGSGFTETAWSGAGSGCSQYVPKPSWQKDTGCANRTVADVAAVADPNTGVALYWTNHKRGGWLVAGGTSAASPIIASVHALAGGSYAPSNPYTHTSALHDVKSGSNGSCGGSYLCTAGAGYDGPTGLGTPSGTGAF